MWALLNGFSIGRILAWFGVSLSKRAVKTWVMRRWAVLSGLASGISYHVAPTLWDKAYKELQDEIATAAEIASGPAAALIRGMTDMPITADMLGKIASGGLSDADRNKIGDWFVDVLDQIFLEDPIAQGYLAREPGTQERLAFRRFVGRNAQLQLAGAIIDLLKDRLPKGLTTGLGELAERMEKILGFEDSQEEIMEPLMEKIIITGMEKRYNRIIKPTDYTPNDAIALFVRGMIDRALLNKVLDNEGVMDDTREHLVQLNAKDLTQSDVTDLYQRGAWDHSAVLGYFRLQGYLPPDAQTKAAVLESDRQWKLAYQLADVYEQQFVRSIIQEGEYEGYLRQLSYTADEVNVLLETARRKRTLSVKTTAKRITGSFNITPERVKEGASAIIKWNIRNADSVTITGLGSVGPRGEEPLAVTRSQTYTLTATNDAGEEEQFFAYVEVRGAPEIKLPRVTLSLSPRSGALASLRELRWNVSGAESVTLDGVPVPEQGVRFVTPLLPTFYTLRATNAAGTASTQDVALIALPDDLIPAAVKPSVTFTISPLVVSANQPQVEIKWGTTNSDSQLLEYPDGHSLSVDANGARLETITDSGVFTFKAKNNYGQTWRQEAVIFKGWVEGET